MHLKQALAVADLLKSGRWALRLLSQKEEQVGAHRFLFCQVHHRRQRLGLHRRCPVQGAHRFELAQAQLPLAFLLRSLSDVWQDALAP